LSSIQDGCFVLFSYSYDFETRNQQFVNEIVGSRFCIEFPSFVYQMSDLLDVYPDEFVTKDKRFKSHSVVSLCHVETMFDIYRYGIKRKEKQYTEQLVTSGFYVVQVLNTYPWNINIRPKNFVSLTIFFEFRSTHDFQLFTIRTLNVSEKHILIRYYEVASSIFVTNVYDILDLHFLCLQLNNQLMSLWRLFLQSVSNLCATKPSNIHLIAKTFTNFSRLIVECRLLKVKLFRGIVTKLSYREMLAGVHPSLNHYSSLYYNQHCVQFYRLNYLHHNVLRKLYDLQFHNVLFQSEQFQPTSEDVIDLKPSFLGGGRYKTRIPFQSLSNFIPRENLDKIKDIKEFTFVKYIHISEANKFSNHTSHLFACDVPVEILVPYMNVNELRDLAKIHGILINSKDTKATRMEKFVGHYCPECNHHISIFSPCSTSKNENNLQDEPRPYPPTINNEIMNETIHAHMFDSKPCLFPPDPPSKTLVESIIRGFCNETQPQNIMESGCAVCGQLEPLTNLRELAQSSCNLDILQIENIGRRERKSESDPITPLMDRILIPTCKHICNKCEDSLLKVKVPLNALANGLWIGEIPEQLRDLSLIEQMLISKIRHNRCVIRVASGRSKMTANAIMFANPVVKIYQVLPPPRKDLEEALAITFIGNSEPTEEAFKRMPLFVRRNKVALALDWLKLNHVDYADLEISNEYLQQYDEIGIPVFVDFKKADDGDSNKIPSATSVHDNELEEGTTSGPCSFTVHGLVGVEFSKLSITALKAKALQHLESQGKTLGIGQGNSLISMYDNPQAYPQMFPWLFPYGHGGIGQARHKNKLSEATHKRQLLMYFDKRFQTDLYFPMIAFNHEQIKAGTTGSFLLSKRRNFEEISNRLLKIDKDVLANLSIRLQEGEHVVPETEKEKACYKILEDLDHVGGHVQGSLTNKKYMRNEIWSMISHLGAPSWFITLSPADNRHPICIYFADNDVEFKPEIRCSNERNLLIAKNPVAAARFFDLMVRMFIKHVLGVDSDHSGLYGKTTAYYGTVEQQGRLTLHLHTVLWILGALSPQTIRDRIMNNDAEFQTKLIEYLEGCHIGEFLTGTMDEIKSRVPEYIEKKKGIHGIHSNVKNANIQVDEYQDPTLTLPTPPPFACVKECGQCSKCVNLVDWWNQYAETVDDLILRSNIHKCSASTLNENSLNGSQSTSDSSNIFKSSKGCINKDGVCKARFPRDIVPETFIDASDGHIFIKKKEAMMNTLSPSLTYIMRCNTDVSSMQSGTAIKAVIRYVTEYISKVTLKTHQIFSSAYDVFDKNSDIIDSNIKPRESARKLILKMVNALSSKMEIGSPMASMYLLGNPDHYTSHQFIPFWWRSYVTHIQNTNINKHSKSNDIEIQNHEITLHEKMHVDETEKDDNMMNVDEKEENQSMHISNQNNLDGGDQYIADKDNLINEIYEKQKFEDNNTLMEEKVILGQNEGQYIAMSNVDDYRFRPEIFDDISLHDWIRFSVKKKKTKREKIADDSNSKHSNTYFQFLPDHPQYQTHVIKCDPLRNNIIPNFIGGSLPRCDQGDREYYCCTMLTLFKPWRTGKSLKVNQESWDEAFIQYTFTDRQKQLMINFNLRYESLDERDDYHAIMKKKAALDRIALVNQDFNEDTVNDDVPLNLDDEYKDPSRYEVLGDNASKKLGQMNEAENIMIKAGWLKKNMSSVHKILQERIIPSVQLTANGWKATVKECRDNILSIKLKNFNPINNNIKKTEGNIGQSIINGVKILNANYFESTFQATKKDHQKMINDIISEFNLNIEQERAFRIVANHSTLTAADQLKMHLGGMGGTGKSQVIKALIQLFERKGESHRFIVLAPTGTAAALLNGSTYHYALGIRSLKNDGADDAVRNEAMVVNEVRMRLQGVDYIFIDEISMIACHELYAISSRLSQVENIHDLPFGGKNMILAGDFAQLPPTQGKALYNNSVDKMQNFKASVRDQENTIGKLLWHQVTTVVILTENMRQKTQTSDDAKLRTALVNMRYAACSEDDIKFLRSRIVGEGTNKPKLYDPKFRNVSIITAWNSQKDKINEMGCVRFAIDTNQKLVDFYSIDKRSESKAQKKKRKGQKKEKIEASFIPENVQNILWNSSPHTSEHIAGKLSLCLGMPVMIRNNDATELCITKGQEAFVVGWESFTGPNGKQVLETLFLKLINPPKEVQIPGLPVNVIPMAKTSKSIKCDLPDDSEINITRQQIQILPNFAMTDYASQGKTRQINVVDLGHCKNFQSYYTCLSRSASAEGTVIIQGFATEKITKGISGFLRQEFRELNILNDITTLRYEKKLPVEVTGDLRNPLIRSYQLYKKNEKIDNLWHPSIKWKDNELSIQNVEEDATWDSTLNTKFVIDLSNPTTNSKKKATTLPITKNKKRVQTDDEETSVQNKKIRKKINTLTPVLNPISPLGLTWDSINYSCAYDAFYTIIYHAWTERQLYVENYGRNGTKYMHLLINGFQHLIQKNITFEELRNTVRFALKQDFPNKYPIGRNNSNLDAIIGDMINDMNCGFSKMFCRICQFHIERPYTQISAYTSVGWSNTNYESMFGHCSIQQYLDLKLGFEDKLTKKLCPNCTILNKESNLLMISHTLLTLPEILIFNINTWIDINISLKIIIDTELKKYILKGIIYLGEEHFTSRIIDDAGFIWYHDGITTKSYCVREINISNLPNLQWLKTIRLNDENSIKNAVFIIYIQE
jgi:hypothetical protein